MKKSKIIYKVEGITAESFALPGKPLSISQFRGWVVKAENSPTISLAEARLQWKSKYEQLIAVTKF